MAPVIVPGLPDHLAEIPPAPFGMDDPEAAEKRLAWRVWRYQVQVYRAHRHQEIAQNPDLRRFEIARCALHPAYWASVWLKVFEPRWRVDPNEPIPIDLDADDPDAEQMVGAKRITIPTIPLIATRNLRAGVERGPDYDPALAPIFGYVPFIPFADQVRVMNELLWTLHQDDEHADAVWSKSRGWGASWVLCLIGLWGWTFSHHWPGAPPWNALYLSRKEEYVDSKAQKSLFWKVRRLMRDIPEWQMPAGWNPDLHDQKGIILNPENDNQLVGESTNAKAGRGDRALFAVLDEAAAIPALDEKWATLTDTADHRWACSTESFQEGSDFYDLQHDDENEFKPWQIATEFWQNPLNDEAWLERTKKRYASNQDAYMQEVWRKPYTGSTWVYPWASDLVYDPALGPVSGYSAFIAADPGYRDPTALISVQEAPGGLMHVLDGYQASGKEADYFAPLLKPSLLDAVTEQWREKDYLVWTSPLDATLTFEYGPREIGFAATVAAMGVPRVIGDTYGETMVGATKDSVYSRWRKYGIVVNRDRKTGEAVTNRVRQNRTFKGRQEAMNELSRRWRFADTPGARMVGNAWKNSKFKAVPEKNAQTEPREPEHDSNSHLRTAGEYLAVYIKHRSAVIGRDLSKPTKTKLGGGQIVNLGAARLSAPRTTLRGVAD